MINVLLFLCCIGGLASLTVLNSSNNTPELFQVLSSIPHHDKWAHFILMAILAYLTSTIFTPLLKNWGIQRPLILIGSAIIVIISLEEISQAYFPARTCSWLDAACGILGVTIALNTYHTRELRRLALHA